MTDRDPSPARTSPPSGRRHSWIWFFVVLGLVAVVAIAVSVTASLRQQLTVEQFQAARQRWREHGPSNYDMEYTLKRGDVSDTYQVHVRDGKVRALTFNGQPAPERLYRYSDIPALFGFIEDYLEQDRQPGRPRVYATASFDPLDGHPQRYVRSVMASGERQEIEVQFHALPR
jgi:hypothetical protein